MKTIAITALFAIALSAQHRIVSRPAVPNLAIGITDPLGVVTPEILAAIQIQVSEHFAPVWQRDARVFIGKGDWQVTIQLANPAPGLAGMHSADSRGVPFAIVSTQTVAGWSWSRVLSHEILEMLANPWGAMVRGPSGMIALEVCDPVEKLSYTINGIEVSDFVTPTYFMATMPGPWDRLGATGPLWK